MGKISGQLTPQIPSRQAIENQIEALIALLDTLDDDSDFEPENDLEPVGDDEPDSDGEPWLGWCGFALRGTMGGLDDVEVQMQKEAAE